MFPVFATLAEENSQVCATFALLVSVQMLGHYYDPWYIRLLIIFNHEAEYFSNLSRRRSQQGWISVNAESAEHDDSSDGYYRIKTPVWNH